MKWIILFLFSLQISFTSNIEEAPTIGTKSPITVYIFLHESCLICQHYTLALKALHEAYANENVEFIGLFPNSSSSEEKIALFKEKYKIPFEFKTDYQHIMKNKLGASITPEVIIYNNETKTILYQGRIDNIYAQIGKKRKKATKSELKDALQALKEKRPIEIKTTQAVGCIINKKID